MLSDVHLLPGPAGRLPLAFHPLLVGAVLLAPNPLPAVADGAARWQPPLPTPLAVVAPFVAPAGPYAPGHRGVDLGAAAATRVVSAGSGVVAFAGPVAGRGVVAVDHPGGLRSTYEPVEPVVHRGQRVLRGQLLGLLSGTGSHARRVPACTGAFAAGAPTSTRCRCSAAPLSGCSRSGPPGPAVARLRRAVARRRSILET